MLKYVDVKVVFQEVPDEITLAINISNCPWHCVGCHSPYLAEDIGKPLNWGSLNALIHINSGITTVCFMGGDSEPKLVNKLAEKVKTLNLKTAWYSGRQELSKDINLKNFDSIKLGGYNESLGSLNYPTTNQRFYKVVHLNDGENELIDITHKFWKHAKN